MASAEAAAKTKLSVELGSESRPLVIRWSSLKGGSYHDSYAIMTGAGAVLVDPEMPDPGVRWRLEGFFSDYPLATVLTSAWHERAAYQVRRAYSVPVWMPEAGREQMEGTPNHFYADGASLAGGLRAICVDPGFAGDSVLHWKAPGGEGVLFSGDALMGGLDPDAPATDHWRRRSGVYAFMHGKRDPEQFKDRFRRLLELDFSAILSAHSPPIREGARQALAELLDSPRSKFVEVFDGTGLLLPSAG